MQGASVSDSEALGALAQAFSGSGGRREKADRAAEVIRAARGYRWVGIYGVGTEEIAAVGWSGIGEPAHPRFPATQGLCGSAAQSGRTVLVEDVRQDPRYLTTFGSTLSEIIVPVKQPRASPVVGLIDVESDRVNAFSSADQAFLERCADALSSVWA